MFSRRITVPGRAAAHDGSQDGGVRQLVRGVRSALRAPRGLTVLFLICGVAFVLLVMAVFGGQGAFKIRQLQRDRALMEGKVAAEEAQTADLRRRFQEFQSGTAQYERAAREKLGLVRPGEVVYDFRKDPLEPAGPQPPADSAR